MESAAATPNRHPRTNLRLRNAVTADISVVIVSYNTCEMTLACVASVLGHRGELTVEVVVVDNQSSDGSAAALREAFPEITVIDSPTNGGFAYGNNIGIEQAHGRYVLLLNPDTQIYAGGLAQCVAFMEANPEVAIMGPRVRLEDGTQQSSMMRLLGLTQFFFTIFLPSLWLRKTAWFGDPRYARLSRDEVNSVDAVSGCFMFARRAIIEQVGGLDSRFFMYGEEVEWCCRVRRAGWKIVYNPGVEILHHGAASTAHLSEWKAVEMTRGHILLLLFTRSAYVAWFGALLMVIRDLVRVPYHAVMAVLAGFQLPQNSKGWWARLKFELGALVKLPKGQDVALPDPDKVRK